MTTWLHNKSDNIYETVAKNIRYYRKQKNMTQHELAEITGYSYAFIRRIEAPECKKHFSIQTIYIISLALDIDIKYLFEKTNI